MEKAQIDPWVAEYCAKRRSERFPGCRRTVTGQALIGAYDWGVLDAVKAMHIDTRFPADGELLSMERPDCESAFRSWALAAGLPVHMAESGLNRFHADDRTEWAWQAWCAALSAAFAPADSDSTP